MKNVTRYNKGKRRVVYLLISVSCIMLYCIFAFIYKLPPFQILNASNDESGINYNPPTSEQKSAGEAIKKAASDMKQSADYSVAFSNISQDSAYLYVRTLVTTVDNIGTCNLKLSKGTAIVLKESSIQAGPSSSTCLGFNVPISELSTGEWNVLVTVKIKDKAVDVSKSYTIR